MATDERSEISRLREKIEDFLGLRVSESSRLAYAGDPLNIFESEYEDRRPKIVALVLALLFHIFLFFFFFPSFGDQILDKSNDVISLVPLAAPPAAGGSPPPPDVVEARPEPVKPTPKPVVVPIPDPTPMEPEPLRKEVTLSEAAVVDEIVADLSIGEIDGPPSPSARRGTEGPGEGPAVGTGPANEGIWVGGQGGVKNPVLIHQTIPSYTDEAIKAKVQGIVLLQAVIRKDGSVTDFRVIRGLGYGLEEKAIQEIANNWKFQPGTRNGQPVNVRATIEVQFNLR